MKDEEALLEAVRSGDKKTVQELINVKHVDVNYKNPNNSGETALLVAVEKEAVEIMEILLRKGADTRSALFQATKKESPQCVRALVENDRNARRGTGPKTLERGTSTTVRSTWSSFDECLTSPAFAILNGDYEIVQFLVSKGLEIKEPQDPDDQKEKETMTRLRGSLKRLNTYRALASPLYIAHRYLQDSGKKINTNHPDDPLSLSLMWKREFKELAPNEGELRGDYTTLSAQSEEFAIQLLEKCRNLEEIAAVMHMPELHKTKGDVDIEELRILSLAIKNRNKKFIAHPYSQVMLNSVVYRGTHRWNRFSSLTRFLLAFLYTLIMPLCILGYMLTPSNRVTEKLEFPLFKLLSHICSMIWLLVLVTMSAFVDKFDPVLRISPLNVLIGIWVAGITVQEIKKLHKNRTEKTMDTYLSEWWQLALIPMIAFYFIATVLWIVAYAFAVSDSSNWTVQGRDLVGSTSLGPYNLLKLSNSFYSLALLLTFFEASHFLQVNSTLGPLHLSLMMMVKDIVRFLALFGINFFAFALTMRRLYSHPVRTSEHTSGHTIGTHDHSFQRFEGTLSTLFWALFGHVELTAFETENAEITEVTGQVIFAGYSLASVLVAVNLLIAMLNNSYKKVDDKRDMKWKFARTRIWMYYINDVSPLPPPFNLVPVEKIAFLIRWLIRCEWRKCLDRIKTWARVTPSGEEENTRGDPRPDRTETEAEVTPSGEEENTRGEQEKTTQKEGMEEVTNDTRDEESVEVTGILQTS